MWLVDGSSPSRSSRLVGNFLSSLPLFRKVFLTGKLHYLPQGDVNSSKIQLEIEFSHCPSWVKLSDCCRHWRHWCGEWMSSIPLRKRMTTVGWFPFRLLHQLARWSKDHPGPEVLPFAIFRQIDLFGPNYINYPICLGKTWCFKLVLRKDWLESHLNVDSWPHTLDEVLCTSNELQTTVESRSLKVSCGK